MQIFIKRIIQIIQLVEARYAAATFSREDRPVLVFLKQKYAADKFFCLEVGSGEGRFANRLVKELPAINLTCLEINERLAEKTRQLGIETIAADILQAKLPKGGFDVIHASHIIEHFGYPEIAQLLDKFVGLLKPGGYLIVRSPLLHPGFFEDLDHVRPYPPGSIMNFFNYSQQQRIGAGRIVSERVWYRREAVLARYYRSRLFTVLNAISMFFWLNLGFPRSHVNGYVGIFKKQ